MSQLILIFLITLLKKITYLFKVKNKWDEINFSKILVVEGRSIFIGKKVKKKFLFFFDTSGAEWVIERSLENLKFLAANIFKIFAF